MRPWRERHPPEEPRPWRPFGRRAPRLHAGQDPLHVGGHLGERALALRLGARRFPPAHEGPARPSRRRRIEERRQAATVPLGQREHPLR
ncbi:hypothetical protein [Chondromyces crocatus]|uniref:hypothetical protein n=1 Tax=Chondromyces crocatus TaxID=52 RepID=UPI0014707850|nr:hypothetical protein [Chondromyces crocatus]